MGGGVHFDGKRDAIGACAVRRSHRRKAFRQSARSCKQINYREAVTHPPSGLLSLPESADSPPGFRNLYLTDIVDKATRSRMMAGIGGRNTKPEVRLRVALHALGLRYRLHDRKLQGRPDLVFPRFRAVVFVHGCFWHRHADCRLTTTPATNPTFWQTKFDGNVGRDARNIAALRAAGWRVAVVWGCCLRGKSVADVATTVSGWLHSDHDTLEVPTVAHGAGSHSATA